MVLVSSEQRALNLQALLREQKMTTAVDFQLHELPGYGKAVIAVGAHRLAWSTRWGASPCSPRGSPCWAKSAGASR
ncbi:hypothetical protein M5E87_06860 [Flavonifractor plautii]|nr:hypothetical protein M5E87_06860 [Flavonifractor plautii]